MKHQNFLESIQGVGQLMGAPASASAVLTDSVVEKVNSGLSATITNEANSGSAEAENIMLNLQV